MQEKVFLVLCTVSPTIHFSKDYNVAAADLETTCINIIIGLLSPNPTIFIPHILTFLQHLPLMTTDSIWKLCSFLVSITGLSLCFYFHFQILTAQRH